MSSNSGKAGQGFRPAKKARIDNSGTRRNSNTKSNNSNRKSNLTPSKRPQLTNNCNTNSRGNNSNNHSNHQQGSSPKRRKKKMSNTIDRLLLLLTDVLGDLKIVNGKGGALWTPESVRQALEKDTDKGGLELASILANPLLGAGSDSTDNNNNKEEKLVDSWNVFLKQHAAVCPPWISDNDLNKKPLVSKLEILSFLASTLENRLLKNKPATNQATTTTTAGAATTATTTTPTTTTNVKTAATPKKAPPSSSSSSTTVDDDANNTLLKSMLPSDLTAQQKEIIMECYQGLKADYDKRRVGMKQRLDILVSNFESDNANDHDMAQLKKQLQSMSVSSATLPMHLSQTELLRHFKTPHSKGLGSRTPIPKSGGPNPLTANLTIVDRGGRTDEAESRITMPKWSSSS